jgi:hypothetical protein
MSTETNHYRFKLDNATFRFRWALSEEMLAFSDESLVDYVAKARLNHNATSCQDIHRGQFFNKSILFVVFANLKDNFD